MQYCIGYKFTKQKSHHVETRRLKTNCYMKKSVHPKYTKPNHSIQTKKILHIGVFMGSRTYLAANNRNAKRKIKDRVHSDF